MDIRGHDGLQGLLQRVGRLSAGGRAHQLRRGHPQAAAADRTGGGGNIGDIFVACIENFHVFPQDKDKL